jgi:hypothetical protein
MAIARQKHCRGLAARERLVSRLRYSVSQRTTFYRRIRVAWLMDLRNANIVAAMKEVRAGRCFVAKVQQHMSWPWSAAVLRVATGNAPGDRLEPNKFPSIILFQCHTLTCAVAPPCRSEHCN